MMVVHTDKLSVLFSENCIFSPFLFGIFLGLDNDDKYYY